MDYERTARLVLCQLQFIFGTYYANLYNTTLFQDLFHDILERRGTLNYKFRHSLFMSVLLIYLARTIYYDTFVDMNAVPTYAHGNFVLFVIHFVNERSMLKIAITFLLFDLVSEYFTFFTTNQSVPWRFFSDIVIRNIEHYNAASGQISNMEKMAVIKQSSFKICEEHEISKSYHNFWLVKLYSKYRAFVNFDLIDKEYFKSCRFQLVDFCVFDARRKSVILLRFLEYSVTVSGCLLFFLVYLICMYFINANVYRQVYQIIPDVLTPRFFQFCVDGVTTFILMIKMFQAGSYLLFYSVSSTLIYSEVCKDATKSLLKGSKMAESMNGDEYSADIQSRRIRQFILRFVSIHTNICNVMAGQNYTSWNTMVFLSFVIMFASNCFYMTRLFITQLDRLRFIILVSIVSVQSTIMIIILLPLAHSNKCFHSVTKHLPRTQISLPCKHHHHHHSDIILKLKFKILLTLERLTNGPQVGTKVGVIGTITYKLLFEVVFIYIAYFLTFLRVYAQ